MTKRTWLPCLPLLALPLSSCQVEEVQTRPAVEEIGAAELSLSDEGGIVGSLKVTALVAATGKRAGEVSVRQGQPSTVALPLRADRYLLHVHAFADAASKLFLGSRSARLQVVAGATTRVAVTVLKRPNGTVGLHIAGPDVEIVGQPDEGAVIGSGASAAPAPGSSVPAADAAPASADGGGAAVDGGPAEGGATTIPAAPPPSPPNATDAMPPPAPGPALLCVPVVDEVKVDIGDSTTRVAVDARGSSGAQLQYVWSGAGFRSAVAGAATVDIPTSSLTGTGATTHALLISKDGLLARVQIVFDIPARLLGVIGRRPSARSSVAGEASVAAAHPSCFDPYAACRTGCRASAAPACFPTCGLSLADCYDRPAAN